MLPASLGCAGSDCSATPEPRAIVQSTAFVTAVGLAGTPHPGASGPVSLQKPRRRQAAISLEHWLDLNA